MSSLAALTLPTVGAELWRYSRIGELDLGSYAIGLADTTVTGAGAVKGAVKTTEGAAKTAGSAAVEAGKKAADTVAPKKAN